MEVVSERKRKAAASMQSTVKRRAIQDFSKMFELPTVCQQTTPMVSQPPHIQIPLYDYQLRSVYRMIKLEANPKIQNLGTFQEEFHCKGGVVADCVGMGKTAQLIGLMLTDLEEETSQAYCNLVVTPSHLCQQWKEEVTKFAGDSLKIIIISNSKQHFQLSQKDITAANVVIVSLDYLTGPVYRSLWHWHHAISQRPEGGVIKLGKLPDTKLHQLFLTDACDMASPICCPLCFATCKNLSSFTSHVKTSKHISLEESTINLVKGMLKTNTEKKSSNEGIPDYWLKQPSSMVSIPIYC
jgi:hypothetical protein